MTVSHRMNLPNLLTFSRVPAMFIIVALMYVHGWWAPTIAFWLFIAAAITDWLDGKLARERNLVSDFGRFMDAVIDKVMVIGIMIALVDADYIVEGCLPTFAVLLILGREFLVSGLRMIAASKGVVISAESGGKIKTLIQLNAIGWLLAVPMFRNDIAPLLPFSIAGWVIFVHWTGVLLFALSAILTITSGATYLRKYSRVLF